MRPTPVSIALPTLAILAMLLVSAPPAHAFLTGGKAATDARPVEMRAVDAPPPAMPTRMATTGDELLSPLLTRLVVVVRHGIAACRLIQVYQNNTGDVLEGRYRLPLPPGAEVHGFAVWDDGKKLVGQLMEIRRAEAVYAAELQRLRRKLEAERRKAQLKDPGLLTRRAGENVCAIRVFPILRRGLKRIEVAYSVPLVADDAGRLSFGFPLGLLARFDNVGAIEADVDLGEAGGVADLRLSDGLTASGDGPTRRLRLAARGKPAGDLAFSWRPADPALTVRAVAHRAGDADGYLLLRALVPAEKLRALRPRPPIDWWVIADTSASMVRGKRLQSLRCIRQVMAAAGPADRVKVLAMGTTLTAVDGVLPDAERRGLPDVAALLREALGQLDPTRTSRVLWVTDAIFATDTADLTAIVRTLPPTARLDVVGPGYDDDEQTARALAEAGRGQYVRAPSSTETRSLESPAPPGNYGELAPVTGHLLPANLLLPPPVLAALRFEPTGGDVALDRVYVRAPTSGSQAVVVARYRGAGRLTGVLRGTLGGDAWEQTVEVELPEHQPANRVIASVWARERIRELEAGEDDEATRAEIVRVSLAHRLVSSRTAFLAVTDEMRRRHGLGAAPDDDIAQLYTFDEGVPEPSTIVLLLLGALVLGGAERRRRLAR